MSDNSVTEFSFTGHEHKDTGLCMVMSDELPGFTLVGKSWEEIHIKLELAIKDFLEFSGYQVKCVEMTKASENLVGFMPTSFHAQASLGLRVA